MSGSSLPDIHGEADGEPFLQPAQRSAEQQAELDATLGDVFAALGVSDRGTDLLKTPKPDLSGTVPRLSFAEPQLAALRAGSPAGASEGEATAAPQPPEEVTASSTAMPPPPPTGNAPTPGSTDADGGAENGGGGAGGEEERVYSAADFLVERVVTPIDPPTALPLILGSQSKNRRLLMAVATFLRPYCSCRRSMRWCQDPVLSARFSLMCVWGATGLGLGLFHGRRRHRREGHPPPGPLHDPPRGGQGQGRHTKP